MTILDTPFDIVTSDKPTDYAGSTWAAGTTVLLVNDPVLGAPNKCWDRLTNTSSFKGYLRYDYVYTPVAGPLRIEIDLYPTARASAGVTSEILTIAGRTSAGHNQSEGDLVVDENGHVVWKLYGTPGSSPYYDQSPVLTLLGAATLEWPR